MFAYHELFVAGKHSNRGIDLNLYNYYYLNWVIAQHCCFRVTFNIPIIAVAIVLIV
jgi:hypothetical protein